MPLLETRGSASARGFGLFGGSNREPAGSYTFANGFSGASYVPLGWATVTVTLYGSGGAGMPSYTNSTSGTGSIVTKTGVPPSTLFIRCPTGRTTSQWSGGGSGGTGAVMTNTGYNGNPGGAVCAATWASRASVLVAAGGGGDSTSPSRASNAGGTEGTNYGDGSVASTTNNGANGGGGGGCYYGGGGGGGGYSKGGNGGSVKNGGNAGGNGAAASASGTGSFNYSTVAVGGSGNAGLGFAKISWG